MYIARSRPASEDEEAAPRLLVSADPLVGWTDLRRWQSLALRRRGATASAATALAKALVPSSTSGAFANGEAFWDIAHAALDDISGDARVPGDVPLTNALDPVHYRDFMTFEEHFSFGYRWQNKPVPDVMYELPISYCGNPAAFIGPDAEVPWPSYTRLLDYELELGIVIGKAGTGLTPETALDHVAGLTILNDISARDIQAREMPGGLGPSKGKHFACATGPYVTTLDSLPADGLRMRARVNGETWCDTSSAEMIWSIAEIVAWTSQGEQLQPGMLLGSGTCNGGSTIEIGKRLAPGDTVELEIEGLGVLRNRLGAPAEGGWLPEPRKPRAI
ncbi:fumarylacetoacetate hydrolase family protein [Streptomyces sp. NPDC091217]|uniref:fumarylacetoacetate hydrolase family protein n=1 Tax=Streptomyces sp. NPDC091217 TaxID=3365975 RepID=UPI0038087EC9